MKSITESHIFLSRKFLSPSSASSHTVQAEILTVILIWQAHRDRQINLRHY